jgi:hypothetical protein
MKYSHIVNSAPDAENEDVYYTSAKTTKSIDGTCELSFTARVRRMEDDGIEVDKTSIFKADGMFFTPKKIGAVDEVTAERTVTCRDLFYTRMYDDVYKNASFAFQNATLTAVMRELILPPFVLVSVEDAEYPAITGDYLYQKRMAIISDIKTRYGHFDIVVDGLNVSVYMDYKRYQPDGSAAVLKKGANCHVLRVEEDRENVITHILYQYADDIEAHGKSGAPVYTAASEFADLWGFRKEIYVEVPDKSALALQRSVTDVLEINKLPKMIYTLDLTGDMHNRLNLYDMVKIKYDHLNVDVELKVISVRRDLIKNSRDIIQIGEKPKSAAEYIAEIEQKTAVKIEKTVSEKVVEKVETVINNTEIIYDTIETVVENTVVVSQNAMFLNCWARNLWVEYFESNFGALDTRQPYPSGGKRNFIRIYQQAIEFFEADVSGTETENFITPDGDSVYWTAINAAVQAYKFFTLTDPISTYPNKKFLAKLQNEDPEGYEIFIEEVRENFRVKVRKQSNLLRREYWGFDENHEFRIPTRISGGGDENGNGISRELKDGDGYYRYYKLRTAALSFAAGQEVGFRYTDDGYLQGLDPKDGNWKRYAMREEDGSIEDLVVDEETGEAVQGKGSAYIVPLMDRPVQTSDLRGRNTLFLQLDSADKLSGVNSAAYHVVNSWYEIEDKNVPEPPDPEPDYTYPDDWESYLGQYPYITYYYNDYSKLICYVLSDKPLIIVTNRATPMYPGMSGSYGVIPSGISGTLVLWTKASLDSTIPWTWVGRYSHPWAMTGNYYFIETNFDVYDDNGILLFSKNM